MKKCGILLPVFSLPSKYGIGSFGKAARDFVDFLSEANQDFWQVLPLHTADESGSPYASESAFACDTSLIDFEDLVSCGLLAEDEISVLESLSPRVDRRRGECLNVLEKAYARFTADENYEAFKMRESRWLNDYALFIALKNEHGGKCWAQWEEKYRLRDGQALKRFAESHEREIEFIVFTQYVATEQWQRLRRYASERNVKIIGDIPIYVSYDSADVWSRPELFRLDGNLVPTLVAGCPPDEFTSDGQLWGNPVYDWDKIKADGYAWWIDRLEREAEFFDVVRLDHFRGFESFYAVEYGSENARIGKWLKGCGEDLFAAVKEKLPNLEFIAEDLGFITDAVRELIEKTGFPNMKVCQFVLGDGRKSEHLPKNYSVNCAAYTGTHDNDTAEGWYKNLSAGRKLSVRRLFNARPFEKISDAMIRSLMRSKAKYVIVPLADWLQEGSEARINTPGFVKEENWSYRLKELPGSKLAAKIRGLKEKQTAENR